MRRFLTVTVLASSVVAGSCGQPSAPPPPPAPATVPVLTAGGPRVYISDETGGAIIVIDPATREMLGRISVGKRPRGLRLSHDGAQLFVALSGSPIAGPGVDESKLPPADRSADGIGVIDLTTGKLSRVLKSGQDPESFDLSPDGARLYVSNEDAAEMSVVDMATGTVASRVKVGEEPEGVTTRPGGREVYVTCEGDGEVVVIDTASGKIAARLKSGLRPRAVAFTEDGATAFITNENDATVTVVDALKHRISGHVRLPQVAGAAVPPRPMGATISPDGSLVFVSLGRAQSIAVIDVKGRKLVRTIDNVGGRPWGITVSADGKTLYTANGPSGDVSIVDVASGTVTARIATGGSPWGAVFAGGR
ncbi:MAG TPA: beta-propeller fold lactonase family protein [Vicinamibacterales bacterium]|nr:beta-propeller fold lactonase family protein [Vicinamibacterales bacterium]